MTRNYIKISDTRFLYRTKTAKHCFMAIQIANIRSGKSEENNAGEKQILKGATNHTSMCTHTHTSTYMYTQICI